MKLDWKEFTGKMINITMNESYGVVYNTSGDSPFYEIVFKTGKLIESYDDGLLLETQRESKTVKIFVPFSSVKCVDIYEV